jgi:hypothetical protein
MSLKPEHDPEKWKPVFPRDKRETRLRGDHAQTEGSEGGQLHPLRSYVPSAVSVSQCVLGVSAIMTTTMMMKSRAKIHLSLSPLVTHASDQVRGLPSGRDACPPLKALSAFRA